jgi:hypothetical protein
LRQGLHLLPLHTAAHSSAASPFTHGAESSFWRAASKSDNEVTILLQETLSKELGRPVTIYIKLHRQLGEWIFIVGSPRETNGNLLDYESTTYNSQMADPPADDVFLALLHRTDERLHLAAFSLGATDSPVIDWSEQFHLPVELFE